MNENCVELDLKWNVVFHSFFYACSICWYECIDSELETAYEQATITAFMQKILFGRVSWTERELHNVQFFWRMPSFSSKIQRDKYPCAVVYHTQCLSFKHSENLSFSGHPFWGVSKTLGLYNNTKTQSEHNETLGIMKNLKISVMKRFFKTNFTLKSERFL